MPFWCNSNKGTSEGEGREKCQIYIAPCKVIQESLGFRIPRCGFRIPCLWIPHSTSMDSGFRIPEVGGFQILDSISWIPDYTDQNYLDSGLPWGDT